MTRSFGGDADTSVPTGPAWFREALGTPRDVGAVRVDGAEVAYRAWGTEGPGLVLVHDVGCNASWWDHIGPLLAHGRRVVAVDLSGHGDSDRRTDGYPVRRWVAEIMAVARAAGVVGAPLVVGHARGGLVGYAAALEYGDGLAGLVMLDMPYVPTAVRVARVPEDAETWSEVFATVEDAIAEFAHYGPAEPFVVDHVVRSSVVAIADGFTWKVDPRLLVAPVAESGIDGRPRCPAAYFRCDRGPVDDAALDAIRDALGPSTVVCDLPVTGHTPMLDSPLVLVAAVRTVLHGWTACDSAIA